MTRQLSRKSAKLFEYNVSKNYLSNIYGVLFLTIFVLFLLYRILRFLFKKEPKRKIVIIRKKSKPRVILVREKVYDSDIDYGMHNRFYDDIYTRGELPEPEETSVRTGSFETAGSTGSDWMSNLFGNMKMKLNVNLAYKDAQDTSRNVELSQEQQMELDGAIADESRLQKGLFDNRRFEAEKE